MSCTNVPSDLTVRLVWLASDWADGLPAQGGQDSYSLGASNTGVVAVELAAAAGTTVQQLLTNCLTAAARKRIDAAQIGVSVLGRRLRPNQRLFDGDRIELLGPIIADPKSERRARVKAEREHSGGVWTRR